MENYMEEEFEWKSLDEIISSEGFKEWLKANNQLENDLKKAGKYYHTLQALKKYYLSQEENYIKRPYNWNNTYPCDWSKIFTPIEQLAWNSIRTKGTVVLYPQYPALNYHIDFANPGLKIGLELDGKGYHNLENDKRRDAELKSAGWVIYRVTGKEMFRNNYKEWAELENDFRYEHGDTKRFTTSLNYWLLETGDGVIEAISQIHFDQISFDRIHGNEDEGIDPDPLYEQFYQSCLKTLEIHQL